MLRRILVGSFVLFAAVGCEVRTQPSATQVVPVEKKESDVHIRTPRVSIDIEKK